MKEIKRIVVPIDLQGHTNKLVDYAVNFANKLDCEIFLFHGIEFHNTGELVSPGEAALTHISSIDFESSRAQHARQQLEKISRNLVGRCRKCTTWVAVGYVVDSIVEYAREQNADLIIIGTHGKRGLEKILLGSVAMRVIKRAHCPTLVLNPYKQLREK